MQSNLKLVAHKKYPVYQFWFKHLFVFTFCNYLKCILQQKGTLSTRQPQGTITKGKQSKLLLCIPERFFLLKDVLGLTLFGEKIFWYQQFLPLKIFIRTTKVLIINRNTQTPQSMWHYWPFLKLKKVTSVFVSGGFNSHSISPWFLSQANH